jgi:hypothetical protein
MYTHLVDVRQVPLNKVFDFLSPLCAIALTKACVDART